MRWIRHFAFALLAILLVFGTYYFIYVSNREEALSSYYLRTLATASQNLEGSLRTLWSNVTSMAKDKSLPSEPKAYFARLGEKCALVPALEPKGSRESLEEFELSGAGTEVRKPFRLWAITDRVDGKGAVRFLVGAGDGVPGAEDPDSIPDENGDTENDAWVATAFLSRLIDQDLPQAGFENVLLAKDGEVVAHLGNSHLQLTKLPRLRGSEPEESDSKPGARVGLASGTHIVDAEVAGTDYKLFLQPVHFPIEVGHRLGEGTEESGDGDRWMLVGFLKSTAMRQDMMTIAPSFVLALVGIIVGGLLAFPYLKLRYIGSRESLRSSDVLVLVICSVAISSFSTITLLYTSSTLELRGDRDEQIEALSREIHSSFRQEISEINSLLKTKSSALVVQEETRTENSSPGTANVKKARQGDADLLADHPLHPYPFLDMAYWMDEEGRQTAKWVVKSIPTPLIDVSTRPYFANVRDGRVWDDGYALQSIRSRTTGEVSGVLCRASPPGFPPDRAYGAVLSPLMSVIDPVIPEGFGFAIIDREGEVLFHSNSDRNLQENLFLEVDAQDELRAAVRAPPQFLNATYHTHNLRLYIAPLEIVPWTLVTFADKQSEWSALTEVLAFALLLLGGHLLLLQSCCALLHWTKPPRVTHRVSFFVWYWPGKKCWIRYLRILVGLSIVVMCWALLRVLCEATVELAVLSSLYAVVAIAFVHLCLRSSANPREILWLPEERTRGDLFRVLIPYLFAAAVSVLPVLPTKESRIAAAGLILTGLIVRRSLIATTWAILAGVIITASAIGGQSGPVPLLVTSLLLLLPAVALCPIPALERWSWARRQWRRFYSSSAVLLLFVVGVLPAASIFFFAHQAGTSLLQKHRQMEFAEDLEARRQRLEDRYRTISLAANRKEMSRRLSLRFDVSGGGWPLDVYSANLISPVPESAASDPRPPSILQNLVTEIRRLLPNYSEATSLYRALETGPPPLRSGMNWGPGLDGKGIEMGFEIDDPLMEMDGVRPGRLTLGTSLPSVGSWPQIYVLAPLGLLGILWMLVSSVAFRLFLLKMRHPRTVQGRLLPENPNEGHRIFLREKREFVRECLADEKTYKITGETIRGSGDGARIAREAGSAPGTIIAWERFDQGLDDPEVADRKIQVLESLLAEGRKRISLFCDIEPLYFLTRLHDDYRRGYRDAAPDVERWASVLESFTKTRRELTRPKVELEEERFFTRLKTAYLEARELDDTDPLDSLSKLALRHLSRECWPTLYLQSLALRLAGHPDLASLARPWRIVEQIGDLAESYYRRLWSQSNVDERLVLHTIAEDGFVNWQTHETLIHLVKRELILATPNFRVMNESFRRFVVKAEPAEVFDRWKIEAGESAWSKLRAPFSITLAVVAFFFFATQRELLDQSLAYLVTLGAGAPALITLVGAMFGIRGDGGDGGKRESKRSSSKGS